MKQPQTNEESGIDIFSLSKIEYNIVRLLRVQQHGLGAWDLYKRYLFTHYPDEICKIKNKVNVYFMLMLDKPEIDGIITKIRKKRADIITFNTFRRILDGLIIVFIITKTPKPTGKIKFVYSINARMRERLDEIYTEKPKPPPPTSRRTS